MSQAEGHHGEKREVAVELLMSHMQYCVWLNLYVYIIVPYDTLCIGHSPRPEFNAGLKG